jgi:hypothetical protein
MVVLRLPQTPAPDGGKTKKRLINAAISSHIEE